MRLLTIVPTMGNESNGEPALVIGSVAIASTTAMLAALTSPNTVKPPFCVSRFALLSARLMNHCELALFGSEPSLAMAIVPRLFERVTLNSLMTGAFDGTVATDPVVSSHA